jgi:hypothetical protein
LRFYNRPRSAAYPLETKSAPPFFESAYKKFRRAGVRTSTNRVDWRALWASGDLARFCFISLGILLHATNETMVATVMPAMIGELASVQLVGWSLAIYELGAIVGSVPR